MPLNRIILFLVTVTYPMNIQAQSVTSTKTEAGSKSSKVGFKYDNYMNGPTLTKDNSQYSINHYFSMKIGLKPQWSVDVVLRPDQKLVQIPEGEDSVTMGDSYLKFETPSLYKTDTSKITLQPRYYAPLSDASKEKGLDGKAVIRLYADKKIGRLNLQYILIPTYHFYKKEAEGQLVFSQGHWLQSSYDISTKWALDFAYYPVWNRNRGEKQVFDTPLAYPGVTYSASDKFSISTYLEAIANKVDAKTTRLGGSVSYTVL